MIGFAVIVNMTILFCALGIKSWPLTLAGFVCVNVWLAADVVLKEIKRNG